MRPLEGMDAGVAFLAVLTLSTLAFVVPDLPFLLSMMVFLLLLSLGYRRELQRYRRSTRGLIGMIVLIAIVQIAINREGPAVRMVLPVLGRLEIATTEGLLAAGHIMARVGILVMTTLLFNSAFTEGQFVDGLSRMRMPYPLIFSLDLTMRTIPRMMEDVDDIVKAYTMVSGHEGRGGPVRRWRTYLALMRPLFLEHMRGAHDLGLSLELRGFTGRSGWRPARYRPHWKDGLAVMFMIMGAAIGISMVL